LNSPARILSHLARQLEGIVLIDEIILTEKDDTDLVVIDIYDSHSPDKKIRASFPISQFADNSQSDPVVPCADTHSGLYNTLNTRMFKEVIAARTGLNESNYSWVDFPILLDGCIFGYIFIKQNDAVPFTDQEIQILLGWANQITPGIIIHIKQIKADQQADRLQTLLQLHQLLTSHLDLDAVFQLIIQESIKITEAIRGTVPVGIYLLEEGQLFLVACSSKSDPTKLDKVHNLYPLDETATGYVVASKKILRVYDVSEDPRPLFERHYRTRGYKSFLSVPLISNGVVIGAFTITCKYSHWFSPEDEREVAGLAPAIVIALENAKMHQQTLAMTRSQERQRIAQDLHDTMAQTLFSIGMNAKAALKNPLLSPETIESLKSIQRLADHSNDELRSSIFALNNIEKADEEGIVTLLEELIQEYQAQSGIKTQLIKHCDDLPLLPTDLNNIIYRIVREALANIRKHARASISLVIVNYEPGSLTIIVQDDGIGISDITDINEEENLRFGIANMRQLIKRANGDLSIQQNDDGGTTVKLCLPV
jgi:signal transduction histidine kinase